MLFYRRQEHAASVRYILLDADPEARDGKHIRHIIERPMNASSKHYAYRDKNRSTLRTTWGREGWSKSVETLY